MRTSLMLLTIAVFSSFAGCPESQTHVGTNDPIVAVSEDQVVTVGDRVTLSGSATDPDDDLVLVKWMWGEAPTNNVTLDATDTNNPWFTPTVPGRYVIWLVAADTRALQEEYNGQDSVAILALPSAGCEATTLLPGSSTRAWVSEGETATWTFCATAGGRMTIQVTTLEGSGVMFVPRLVVLAPDGSTLAEVSGSFADLYRPEPPVLTLQELPATQTGVYTLLCTADVADPWGAAGYCELLLTID